MLSYSLYIINCNIYLRTKKCSLFRVHGEILENVVRLDNQELMWVCTFPLYECYHAYHSLEITECS